MSCWERGPKCWLVRAWALYWEDSCTGNNCPASHPGDTRHQRTSQISQSESIDNAHRHRSIFVTPWKWPPYNNIKPSIHHVNSNTPYKAHVKMFQARDMVSSSVVLIKNIYFKPEHNSSWPAFTLPFRIVCQDFSLICDSVVAIDVRTFAHLQTGGSRVVLKAST